MKYRINPSLAVLLATFCFVFEAGLNERGARAAESKDFQDFEKHIRPVLVEQCYACHSAKAKKVKGGLLLDTREGIRRGGDSGPAVVPGKPDESLLLDALRYDGFEMPPSNRLPEDVVKRFEAWIASGAPDPRDGIASEVTPTVDIEAGRKFWSFQPLRVAAAPRPTLDARARNDIDRFLLAGLEAKGLRPAADALPADLLRRATFDLTGLPPTSDEVGAFVLAVEKQSKEGEAFAAVVERLLASPRFGERWGRHWLDVARYAESTGGGHNVLFPLAYRYRDWVIDSLNADKPYDRFIREQIAGDLLPARDAGQRNEQLAATGFLVVGMKDLRENNTHRFRMAMADEQIDAVGRAFLGLTLACAKCHDHKFDPIPTADYYALAGIFTSSEPMLGARRNRQRNAFAAGLLTQADAAATFSDDDLAKLLQTRVDATYKRLAIRDEQWRILDAKGFKKDIQKYSSLLESQPAIQKLRAELKLLEERLEELRRRYTAALPHTIMGMRESTPTDCAIHIRGEDTQLGPVVPRGFPQVLVRGKQAQLPVDQSGRLQLAQWMADPNHPLTARVMVNRTWQQLFGIGLVETPDDFGYTGQPPSNPELLDYLAHRFITHGWSLKTLIAEIMQSRAYQLNTTYDAKSFELDPNNRLLWRSNRRRLDSDALFDAIRQISNDLVLTRPEPVIPPMPDDDRVKSMDLKEWFLPTARHRTIYQPVLRDHIPEDWKLFDFPDPELVTGIRSVTTVPTQSLHLMNSPFIATHAKQTAAIVIQEGGDDAAIIRSAYLRILNRSPGEDEIKDAKAFLIEFRAADADKQSAVAALCQSLFASAEFVYLH
ncbi:Planctomycete cytochrome C [Anatilimnocola aggregata]|uniref:Planctomycete cytochrome C n=1 Tax=Anatilimnocola aggregata TaxID=2528021 RepID=A0A517Y5A5_9BACT|nr:PSD1 and planctomycete cytochrome C domain-containing protein [Anatilimnocola aggregata]QDU25302.1 Planctomycete cytochrome C [Anatilimnocola aggregata]